MMIRIFLALFVVLLISTIIAITTVEKKHPVKKKISFIIMGVISAAMIGILFKLI